MCDWAIWNVDKFHGFHDSLVIFVAVELQFSNCNESALKLVVIFREKPWMLPLQGSFVG